MIKVVEFNGVYAPAEDSMLLLKAVKYARGEVLDLCAGTGIIGLNAAKKSKLVTFVDINPFAIEAIKYNTEKNHIKNYEVVKSDLFTELKKRRFDVMYVNPPYLPEKPRKDWEEYALSGGGDGSEITLKIIRDLKGHLKKGGKAFFILSTVYDINKVYKEVKRLKLNFRKLSSINFFFEELILIEVYDKSRNCSR